MLQAAVLPHVRCPTLYMYDAVSLQLMNTLLPGAGAISQSLTLGVYNVQPGVVWGVYGLLLMHNSHDEHRDTPEIAQKTRASADTGRM